jgi:hypothetical protein
MRWYGSAPGASMHMHEDPELIEKLEALMRGSLHFIEGNPWVSPPECVPEIDWLGPIDVAIETGTYKGTGSTRFISQAFARTQPAKVFHTIEVNFEAAMEARQNLAPFPFVRPHWGCSVRMDEAEQFLQQDRAFLESGHAFHPDVWTDHMSDAVLHYTAEVRGSSAWRDRPEWEGEDLLRTLLEQHKEDQPLVILDSAGGIGRLEYQIMVETMGDRRYYVLLDDVEHVKHYRSFRHMQSSPDFRVISHAGKWALGVHHGQ